MVDAYGMCTSIYFIVGDDEWKCMIHIGVGFCVAYPLFDWQCEGQESWDKQ